MRKFHKPIRMCVICRSRFFQSELYRFASINGEIIKNPSNARSFYVCDECIRKDEKYIKKILLKFCKNSINLKEMLIDG